MWRVGRESNGEGGAVSDSVAGCDDGAAVRFDDRADDREADPGAAAGA